MYGTCQLHQTEVVKRVCRKMNNPKNPKLTKCAVCRKSIKGKWWMQISHRVYCIEHFKEGIKKHDKKKK